MDYAIHVKTDHSPTQLKAYSVSDTTLAPTHVDIFKYLTSQIITGVGVVYHLLGSLLF